MENCTNNLQEEEEKTPLISIVIPIYNIEKYLPACLESIVNQTYRNLEIILVDDGSQDHCPQICDDYAERDERIKVIHKKNEKSLPATRLKGIELAQGSYVSFVDGDDWLEKDFYERAVKEIVLHNNDMICLKGYYKDYEDGRSNVHCLDKIEGYFDGKEDFEKKVFPNFVCLNEFYSTNIPITLVCYLFRKNLIEEAQCQVNSKIRIGEDMLCLWFCLLKAASISIINYAGYHYRQHDNSMMHTANEKEINLLKILFHDAVQAANHSQYNCSFLMRKLVYWIYFALMLSCYDVLLRKGQNCLFPYSKVKIRSKIIIYGAGVMGRQIKLALLNHKEEYEVVGWTDKGWKKYREQDKDIIAPDDIKKLNYDYIIIAVTRASTAREIKNELYNMKIPSQKIATIDSKLLVYENLPEEILGK